MKLIFGIHMVISLILFIRNIRKIKSIPLFAGMLEKMTATWRLGPAVVLVALGITVACMTGYYATSLLVSLCLIPVLQQHWIVSPLSVRSVSGNEDTEDGSYGKIISRGVRSRILALCICADMFLMYYAFFRL